MFFFLQKLSKESVRCKRVRLYFARALRLRAVTIAMNCVPRDNLARPTRGSQLVMNTGHYQRFINPHVTHSLPIGIAKLSIRKGNLTGTCYGVGVESEARVAGADKARQSVCAYVLTLVRLKIVTLIYI